MTPLVPHASHRSVLTVRWMRAGLVLTVLVGLAPLVDLATTQSLAGHVRDAYPKWSQPDVDADTYAIAGFLVAVGVLGTACWLWVTRLVARGSTAAPAAASLMFVLAVLLAAFGFAPGGAYDMLLPTSFAVIGFVPCVPGFVAVTRL